MSQSAPAGEFDTFPKLLAPERARRSATAPPIARRNTASGRAGPGPRPRPRSWRWPRAWPSSGSGPATTWRSSAATGRELYWAMVAAQVCGAVPVPLYQDAVAEEMAYVLEHCGARFVVAGDQEQVDKVLEVSARLPRAGADRLSRSAGPPELRPRAAARLRRGAGRGRGAGGAARAALRARIAGQGADDTCVMLYTSGHHRAAEGGGAVEPQHHRHREGERRSSTG